MVKDSVSIKFEKWSAQICPRLGANVISLKYDTQNVLSPLEDEKNLEINPYIYGAPLLLPANRTYLGKFSFEGREYTLPVNEPNNFSNLHGGLWNQPFEIVKVTNNTVKMKFTDKDGSSYPFPFEITVTYGISERGFESVYEIVNIGNENMPLTFGLHTSFCEPERFNAPIDACFEKDAHHIPTGRYVELNDTEKTYAQSAESRGRIISGYYRSCGKTAQVGDFLYTVSENFDHWTLYNGQGKIGILCVEPQCGKVNGLNFEDGHKILKSREPICFYTLISKIKK